MTTTFVTRTADLMPALQPAPAQIAAQVASCTQPTAPVQGTGMSASGRGRSYAAAARTGLVVDALASVERHVAVIGTSQVVSPVVIGSGVAGSDVNGKDVFPALRTWRPPV